MDIISTERLHLRVMRLDDAEFYLRLVNEPTFISNIRDKGIRTVEESRTSIETGALASQEKFGFSFYVVEDRMTQAPMGICGLTKRDSLDDVDLGYAFLPEFCGLGYAFEAALAVLTHTKNSLPIKQLAAITSPTNERSNRLLIKLGFIFQKITVLVGESEETSLYRLILQP
jgi:[ribosomal protein S5]-alanine N-acetyltransferase